MNINDSSRLQLLIKNLQVDRDPADGLLVLAVDNTEYPCTWDGPATATGSHWTRSAHTSGYFAGPRVPADRVNGATILTYGLHPTELRLTIGGTIIAQPTAPIIVRAD